VVEGDGGRLGDDEVVAQREGLGKLGLGDFRGEVAESFQGRQVGVQGGPSGCPPASMWPVISMVFRSRMAT
jgi:hypothetical protein